MEHAVTSIPLAIVTAAASLGGSVAFVAIGRLLIRSTELRRSLGYLTTVVAIILPLFFAVSSAFAWASVSAKLLGCSHVGYTPQWVGATGAGLVFLPWAGVLLLSLGRIPYSPIKRGTGVVLALVGLAMFASGAACSLAYASGFAIRVSGICL